MTKQAPMGHKLVVKVAVEMAEASFEELLKHNEAYDEFKRLRDLSGLSEKEVRRTYLRSMTPFFIQSARATLALLLSTPMSEQLKDTISDALIKDHAFQASRSF